MDLEQAILERGSVKAYDPDVAIDDAELASIFKLVERSPSSFNLQHWRFVCVRDQGLKDRVMGAAWNQAQLGQCSVIVAVCSKLPAHEDAERCWEWAPDEVKGRLVPMIGGFYAENPQLQRDEAIRSGSLAAMTLMLVAQSRGWNSCPMIGFDPTQVCEILAVPADHVPVMLVTLGKGATPPHGSERLPMADTVMLDRFGGSSLQA
jgi:nitroreductase